jgi:hypothetical protein
MKIKLLSVILSCFSFAVCLAQKTAYIPLYIQDVNGAEGSQFSWDKTAQSDNFTLIWGNIVGTDPANYTDDPSLAFNPEMILGIMEDLYVEYKDLGFLDDAEGTNLALYKVPIVMYGTWGDGISQGYANGGDVDGVIGAFWVHPIAMQSADVAAHEFAHSLQAQCIIDYRNPNGLGGVWNNAGIFWETHANFMRNLLYPQDVSAWGMDLYHIETWGDWKNTYENYHLLFGIMEDDGIDIINRMWRESLSDEYPLQAYKRLSGYNQEQFNDKLYGYARRMATMDFPYNDLGVFLREYRQNDLNLYLQTIQAAYTILHKVPDADNRYEVPIEEAPEEFAYNVVPLHVEEGSCSVILKFKGHTEANTHAGWRYGFVAAHADGTISRYSDTYSNNTKEIAFALEENETALYFVVMGAPFDEITTNTSNDTWHGYPKHFRFPYEISLSGAVPEGYQPAEDFRAQIKIDGHLHTNGGGWVQNSATVAESVYVGPHAIVLGNATITGNVRLEDTSLVSGATLSGNVLVQDNAFVRESTCSGDAVIQGRSFLDMATMSGNAVVGMRARVTHYDLAGTVEVGGDVVVYHVGGSCDNGVHYVLTNYYDDKLLQCDGRTAQHPDNLDVNSIYNPFSDQQMAQQCTCETLPECLSLGTANFVVEDMKAYPNPASGIVALQLPTGDWNIKIYNSLGAVINVPVLQQDGVYRIDVSALANGIYMAAAQSGSKKANVKIVVAH